MDKRSAGAGSGGDCHARQGPSLVSGAGRRENQHQSARRAGGGNRLLDEPDRAASVLSPAVVKVILDGTLRGDITGATFIQSGAIPNCWFEQQASFLPR